MYILKPEDFLSVAEVRNNFSDNLQKAQNGEVIVVSKNGKPKAAIIPIEMLNILLDYLNNKTQTKPSGSNVSINKPVENLNTIEIGENINKKLQF